MDELRLRFIDQRHPDLTLTQGQHGLARTGEGGLGLVQVDDSPLVNFCVDRRGIWMTVGDGNHAVHVNGRPVRRMAMLRAGDDVYVDGTQLALVASTGDERHVLSDVPTGSTDPRVVLRGVGGRHHGRSFTLERPRLVGRVADADIRIDDPSFAERHARFEWHPEGVVLRDLGSPEGSVVNGHEVRDVLLQPGDQVTFDAIHRFVLEAPAREMGTDGGAIGLGDDLLPDVGEQSVPTLRTATRRLPWLLLAALLLAAALAVLLLYGSAE